MSPNCRHYVLKLCGDVIRGVAGGFTAGPSSRPGAGRGPQGQQEVAQQRVGQNGEKEEIKDRVGRVGAAGERADHDLASRGAREARSMIKWEKIISFVSEARRGGLRLTHTVSCVELVETLER